MIVRSRNLVSFHVALIHSKSLTSNDMVAS